MRRRVKKVDIFDRLGLYLLPYQDDSWYLTFVAPICVCICDRERESEWGAGQEKEGDRESGQCEDI